MKGVCRLSEARVGRRGVLLPRLPFGRQGFTITARLTALSREDRGGGVVGGIVSQLRSSMIMRMFSPGSLRSPGAGTCDARFTGLGDYVASPRLGWGGAVCSPQTPYRSSGGYDNDAPRGAFTWRSRSTQSTQSTQSARRSRRARRV